MQVHYRSQQDPTSRVCYMVMKNDMHLFTMEFLIGHQPNMLPTALYMHIPVLVLSVCRQTQGRLVNIQSFQASGC